MKVLISGVSSGIGLSIARNLKEHEIWGISRRDPPQEAPIRFTACDLTSWFEVSRAAAEVAGMWKNFDGLIHCAGMQGAVGPAMELPPEKWVETVRANTEGAFFIVRAFFEHLVQRTSGHGKIILFSGGGAARPRPYFTAYGCAKTALVRLTETLAAEWADLPVDINIVAPGAINTAMTDEIVKLGPDLAGSDEYERSVLQLERGGDSIEKVFALVRFLLSPASDGFSGKFVSAQWDKIGDLRSGSSGTQHDDRFTLRRIAPS